MQKRGELQVGQRALVMGLGRFGGGVGVARHLARRGLRVTVTDRAQPEQLASSVAELRDLDLEFVLGEHRARDFESAELVVANPAVRPDHPLLATARSSGARITSEIELFLEAVHARVVCITGTEGKSTTCHILAKLLEASGQRVFLGGNIGGSLLGSLDRIAPEDFIVLELSSYQLEALEESAELGARIRTVEAVAVTNLRPDHIDRHGSFEAYGDIKHRILNLLGPGGVALVANEEGLRDWIPARGRRLTFGEGLADYRVEADGFRASAAGKPLARLDDLRLTGGFQRLNALAALGIAHQLGIEASDLSRGLRRVRGLEHRLEYLGATRGRRIHDNGVSTTPDSTISALRSLPTGIHLLLGGRSKGLPLGELVATTRERVRRVTLFGEARDELARSLAPSGVEIASHAALPDALADALMHTSPGSDLLFSPACSSFDAYPNFRARARAFRDLLPQLETSAALHPEEA